MYQLDLSHSTPRDLIERAMTCHPGALQEALRAVSKTHYDYARITHSLHSRNAAMGMVHKLADAHRHITHGNLNAIMRDCGTMVMVYDAACALSLVPRQLRAEIIGRHETACAA